MSTKAKKKRHVSFAGYAAPEDFWSEAADRKAQGVAVDVKFDSLTGCLILIRDSTRQAQAEPGSAGSVTGVSVEHTGG
jgi:hypothetical protein